MANRADVMVFTKCGEATGRGRARFHARRTAGCPRHHRHSDCPVAAGRCKRPARRPGSGSAGFPSGELRNGDQLVVGVARLELVLVLLQSGDCTALCLCFWRRFRLRPPPYRMPTRGCGISFAFLREFRCAAAVYRREGGRMARTLWRRKRSQSCRTTRIGQKRSLAT